MLHSSEILKDAWTFGGDLLKFLAICGQKYEVKLQQICFQNKIKKNKKKIEIWFLQMSEDFSGNLKRKVSNLSFSRSKDTDAVGVQAWSNIEGPM